MNQPNFCYVLTTTARDLFADMTYVSAVFLRYAHPEAKIICLCDAPSHRAIEEARHPLLEVVDRAEAVEAPHGTPMYRNRSVKTRMRQILDGDFVYIDADALVVDRIDEMLACPAPMAAIPNFNGTGDSSEITDGERAVFEKMNWPLPRRPYINGGVLLLRDCEPTRRFTSLWHEKWLACCPRADENDQTSLNSALADSGIDYEVLGNRFNAQVNWRPSICRESVAVWHFYSSQNDWDVKVPMTILDEAIARFRAEGRLTPQVIRELREWPYPWRTPTMLDRWFVRHHVVRKDTLPGESASRYWLAGHRRKAVMKCLTGFVGYRLITLGTRLVTWR